MGKSIKGETSVLVRRYEQAVPQEGQVDEDQREDIQVEKYGAHATEPSLMVMVGEATGNKYMRMVDHKGLGGDGDNSWLVKDMH